MHAKTIQPFERTYFDLRPSIGEDAGGAAGRCGTGAIMGFKDPEAVTVGGYGISKNRRAGGLRQVYQQSRS